MFAGDPLPEGDREALVPIRAERSVDQDLLEDASRSDRERAARAGLSRRAAPYTREEKGGELVADVHDRARPAASRRIGRGRGQRRASRAADLAPLLQIKAGDPFVEARVGLVAAAITELYRVRGFAQAAVKPDIQVLPAAGRDDVTYRPGRDPVRNRPKGPQTIVSGVDVEGTTAIRADRRCEAQMALHGGRPFYRPQLSADRDAIERAYRNQGFQSVSVISQLAFADDQQLVAITWTIREGEQIKVDRVLINGNARISTRADSPRADDSVRAIR